MDRVFFRDQLRNLLHNFGEATFQAQLAQIAERLHAANEIYIFGAGENGRFVASLLSKLRLPITGYLDETPSKQNTILNGIPVLPLSFASGHGNALVICSIFSPHVGFEQLFARLKSHTTNVISLFEFLWVAEQDDASFYFLSRPTLLRGHLDDLMWLCEGMVDEESLQQLCAHVQFRLTLNYSALPAPRRTFWPTAIAHRQIMYIDCGAYDGDTLVPFMRERGSQCRLAFPLEPDPGSFERLKANIAGLEPNDRQKIIPIPAATGRESTKLTFSAGNNQASALSESGEIEVQVKALDEIIDEHSIPGDQIVIKVDVEGADLDTLQGARRAIVEREPWLAMSVYHKPSDLWTLPRHVAGLNQDYRFALRSNGADGADLMIYAFIP
jgi:FkbM family methyltransferase